jgi:glucosamine 6-phosphate synthetase-like amidotransferase/phosphosugar isomerase protein
MCQLAAYIGRRPVAPLLLDALEYQEPLYGGHATGIAAVNGGKLNVVKGAGPVAHVMRTKQGIAKVKGTCAIAHSRYSDNARDNPDYNTDEMAHPFTSEDGKLALMHNGGISNYRELWKELEKTHKFKSHSEKVDDITDSEVAVHMLGDALAAGKSMVQAFQGIAPRLEGTFLLAAIHADDPDTVTICNWHQPCYLALGENEAMFVSSRRGLRDMAAYMDRIYQPPKNSVIRLTRTTVETHTMDPDRSVPQLHMNPFQARRMILETLREEGRKDIRELYYELHPEGWASVHGILSNEWTAYRKDGVYVMNPYFELLEAMTDDEDIDESIDPRAEGGVENVPRFSYVLG